MFEMLCICQMISITHTSVTPKKISFIWPHSRSHETLFICLWNRLCTVVRSCSYLYVQYIHSCVSVLLATYRKLYLKHLTVMLNLAIVQSSRLNRTWSVSIFYIKLSFHKKIWVKTYTSASSSKPTTYSMKLLLEYQTNNTNIIYYFL